MIRKTLITICLVATITTSIAQISSSYSFEKEMPVFMDELKKELIFPLAWGNSPVTGFSEWRQIARQQVYDCMLTPPYKASGYDLQVIDVEKRDGYTANKIEFNITTYSRIPAYLLVPEGEGPFPAVVLLHDHGARFSIGKEKMIRPFDVTEDVLTEADKWAEQCYDSQYCGDYLAANGYVVIAIDALFWGERGRKEGISYDGQQAVAANFELLGRSWSGFISYEDIYTVEMLASLPYVDAFNIGCMGFSMGAYRAWMLSALTDQVKAGAAVCWMNTLDYQMSWDNKRNTGGSAFSMLLPGLRNYLDYPHIASIACPKPMLFYNGTADKLFPVEGVEAAYKEMREVWESQSAGDKLITQLWELPHFCSKEMQLGMLEFFNEHLK